jgi:hypothetical protein
MMLALLLTRPTFAIPADVECATATLVDSLPRQGDVDVPIDIAPLLVFDQGSCGPAFPLIVQLKAGESLIDERRYESGGLGIAGTWTVDLDLPELSPNTAYVLDVQSEWAGEQALLGFTTGSAPAAPRVGLPEATLESVDQIDLDGIVQVDATLQITPVHPSSSAVVVRANGVERAFVLVDGPGEYSVSWVDIDRSDEVCVSVVERDDLGAWIGPSDESCMPGGPLIDGARGCSHTPAWTGLFALLPLAFVRRGGAR